MKKLLLLALFALVVSCERSADIAEPTNHETKKFSKKTDTVQSSSSNSEEINDNFEVDPKDIVPPRR